MLTFILACLRWVPGASLLRSMSHVNGKISRQQVKAVQRVGGAEDGTHDQHHRRRLHKGLDLSKGLGVKNCERSEQHERSEGSMSVSECSSERKRAAQPTKKLQSKST